MGWKTEIAIEWYKIYIWVALVGCGWWVILPLLLISIFSPPVRRIVVKIHYWAYYPFGIDFEENLYQKRLMKELNEDKNRLNE